MRNWIIAALSISVLVLLSFLYKLYKTPVLGRFPLEYRVAPDSSGEPPLYLYLFFSKHNCSVCLEAIQVLNMLKSPFVVTGIVPGEELKNEDQLRRTTGATFKLIGFNASYRRFVPRYQPALFGIAQDGSILFVMPGVPGEQSYLYDFLSNFYGKSLELLLPVGED
jgi:hypothetical protein